MRKKVKLIKTFFSGFFMGVAGLVPGVSSGTVAVIAGIYNEMIESLRKLTTKSERKAPAIRFLAILFSGMIIATFLFAQIMEIMMGTYPIQMNLFFIGLIVGTTPLLYCKSKVPEDQVKVSILSQIIPALIALLLVLWMGSSMEKETTEYLESSVIVLLLIFLAGFISSGTGLIPGVSGSMVLLSLGLYTHLISSINQLNWIFLITLAIGAFVGFIFFSKMIYFVLKNYAHITYYIIIGLLIGSAINLWPKDIISQEISIYIIGVIVVIIGFALSYFVGGEKKDAKNDYI